MKLKTKRGAAKRFKMTGGGKVKRSKAYASHLLSSKTTKRKRKLRKNVVVDKRDSRNVKRLIPYA
ncbi:MAG TPA: 50S ribosomal protein L35 [Thermodesulfobacteriota bacterium]|nr:50S ribosomal protein L35 [Thermodesulfobacteriota bacterium]